MTTVFVCAIAAIVCLSMLGVVLAPFMLWSGMTAFLEARDLRAQADAMDEFLAEL